jgi:hypothetical protein
MATAKPAEGVQFSIHMPGDTTGKTWAGDFRAKELLTFRDKLNADRLRRELVGDAPGPVDPEAAASALILSQLSVRLTEVPEWWKEAKGGLLLADWNVIDKVYTEAMAIEDAHLKKLRAEGEAATAALRASEGK